MKKQFITLMTILSFSITVSAVCTHHTPMYQDDKKKGDNAETLYRAAQKEFAMNPEDKTAEEKYINAVKHLWEEQNKRSEERKKIAQNASSEQKALWAKEKELNAALKAWKADVNSLEKQNTAIALQKEVFTAQKAAAPIFVLNDKIIEDLGKIDFSKMGKGSYLCNEEAVKKYGDKGRNGAVILKYKDTPTTPKEGYKAPYGEQKKDGVRDIPSHKATPEGHNPHSRVPMAQMRMEYLFKACDATAVQKPKVKEIFDTYNSQIESLRRKNTELLRSKDSGNISKITENNVIIEQKRAEMYKNLSEVLSAEQLTKLYRAEIDFAKNMVQGKFSPAPQGNNRPDMPPMR